MVEKFQSKVSSSVLPSFVGERLRELDGCNGVEAVIRERSPGLDLRGGHLEVAREPGNRPGAKLAKERVASARNVEPMRVHERLGRRWRRPRRRWIGTLEPAPESPIVCAYAAKVAATSEVSSVAVSDGVPKRTAESAC